MNVFEIDNDRLLFKNKPVALLQPVARAVRRDLEDAIGDYATADDFEDEHREALKAEYDRGFEAGHADGEQDAKNALEDRKEVIEAAAFDKGYAQAMEDASHAADAARVQILLDALQSIHNMVQPLWLGIEEQGAYKRRAAKTGETKRAAQSACAEAHRALNAYRAS